MKVVLLTGVSFQAPISPEELLVVCKLVQRGVIEAVIVEGAYIAPVRKVDPELTFGDMLKLTVHCTAPPDSETVASGHQLNA